MAVYNKNFEWTNEAIALDDELRMKIKPILAKAIEDGLRVEDIHYIACNCVFEELITTVLWKKSELERGRKNGILDQKI